MLVISQVARTVSWETKTPRRGKISISPPSASVRSASRTVPRDVSRRAARATSGSRDPGANSPWTMASLMWAATAVVSVSGR